MCRPFFLFLLTVWLALPGMAGAQEFTALARLAGAGVRLEDRGGGLDLILEISQPVPWRVFTLEEPRRLILDFSELDWSGLDPVALLTASETVNAFNAGLFRPGWSRLVIELAAPMIVAEAGMKTAEDSAEIRLRLEPCTPQEFAANAGTPLSARFAAATETAPTPGLRPAEPRGGGPLVVVLDPGHGGIDPGAEREGAVEADLMLRFARELQEVLLRSGGFTVVLTREDDIFVPLEERVTIARRAGADVFLSLHADALAQGRASGATVYTLSGEASDVASAMLAERHDQADLLAGVDLSGQGDEVALVLMDLARRETAPRSELLADALVEGIHAATQSTYKSPRLQAGFSVLKAPDIPSVLIELGFLSSPRDRRNLMSEEWRLRAAEGIRDALQYWAIEDAARTERLRR